MNKSFQREIGLLTYEQYEKLKNSLIILFGLGGVGGMVFEMLVRVGIENFHIIDMDKFEESNINRQLMATIDTLGKNKTDICKIRAETINKNAIIIPHNLKITCNNIDLIFDNIKKNDYSCIYIIDCIDDINAKFEIIKKAKINNLNIISCMGTATHLSSTNIKINNIFKTKYCPVAKILRKKIRDANIDDLDVLFFDEEPIDTKVPYLSTISVIPNIAGIKIAEYVIKKIIK